MDYLNKKNNSLRNTILFCLVAIICFSIFAVRAEHIFDYDTNAFSADYPVKLENDTVIMQEIPRSIKNLV